jgi:Holliday junction resolvase RusA-like endonuclease
MMDAIAEVVEIAAMRDYYHQLKQADVPLTMAANLYSVPKGRPRFSGNHAYTPATTRLFEDQIRTLAESKGWKPYSCPVHVDITIQIEIPKSYGVHEKLLAKLGMLTPPRGDLDNRVKAIKDALNKVAYYDDVQVTSASQEKVFGEKNLITVTVSRAGLSDTEIDRYKKLKKVGHVKRNSGSRSSVG